MPLNPTDLEQWMADPEEWVNNEDKENDLWEYEIRVRRLQRGRVHFCEYSVSLAVKEFLCSCAVNTLRLLYHY
jgi:hypothetical protein